MAGVHQEKLSEGSSEGPENQRGAIAIVDRMAKSEKELKTWMLNLEDELNFVKSGMP